MKRLVSVILLLTACSSDATSHNFIGCNWHIPAGFEQLSDNEYRKIPANDDLTTSFSSVLFSPIVPEELTTLIEMDNMPDTEVLVISHPDDSRYSYQSVFTNRKTRFGDSISSDTLRVSAKDQVVALIALTPTDSFHLTSSCVPPAVIEQHYAILEQLAQGIVAFLNTEHGLSVLVPQSE
ncbi:MAG: hypothetical protein KKE30_12270 [Gammaproteobacteria bacterium]|nr:hypothetical protein [Gammaproteobacteria bacterium]MBU1554808.1 hypothetical protein [Gammaproteobacteria bacterium]MBU2070272.1 hypothetical protein [Gammaproteobacteria bacterium]MBU2183975.1 hypothetical protein [Gammaproteobacteria bacterium]MBU2206779.1 hypothetical protein [Gammaproteobacteria bacterium]